MRALLLAAIGLGLLSSPPPLNYRSWHRVTAKPVDMKPWIAVLCEGPHSWDRAGNPHVPKVFHVYVNPIGKKAMLTKRSVVFPNGTILVKEKWSKAADMAGYPELLTVMTKKDGHWVFSVADGHGNQGAADQKKCMSCHEKTRENDYVFRTYMGAGYPYPSRW